MKHVIKAISIKLKKLLNILLITGMFVLTFDVLWGVISRYLIGQQSTFTEPLAKSLLVWVTMLGGAVAYSDRAHLGVDFFVGLLHQDARQFSKIIIPFIVFLFAGLVMGWGGMVLSLDRFSSGQTIPGLWGIQRGYIYLSVPISGFFICLFAIEQLLSALCFDEPQPCDSPPEGLV